MDFDQEMIENTSIDCVRRIRVAMHYRGKLANRTTTRNVQVIKFITFFQDKSHRTASLAYGRRRERQTHKKFGLMRYNNRLDSIGLV